MSNIVNRRFENPALTPEFWALVQSSYADYPDIDLWEYLLHYAVCCALNPDIWGNATNATVIAINEIYSIVYSCPEPNTLLLDRIDQNANRFEFVCGSVFNAGVNAFAWLYQQQPAQWASLEIRSVHLTPNQSLVYIEGVSNADFDFSTAFSDSVF